MFKHIDRREIKHYATTFFLQVRKHSLILGFSLFVLLANTLIGSRTVEVASSGITIPVEKITTAQINTVLSYLQEYAPPLASPNRTQDTDSLFADGNFFINKPLLPNTIVSTLPRERITAYTVAEGDTIYTIAYRYELSIETIKWANDLDTATNLKAGQQLKIPPVNGLIYTVAEGDTLDKLARSYRISRESIDTQNKLAGNLTAGQTIILPGAKKFTSGTGTASRGIIAAPGETVWEGSVLSGTGNFRWPLTSPTRYITQYYGWVSKWYKHTGLDLDFRNGLDILASDQGTVVAIGGGYGGGYGNHIVVDHGNGYQTLYAHLSGILVNVGDSVESGQKIGIMGTTGFSTGVHLHFELRINGVAQNPLAFIK